MSDLEVKSIIDRVQRLQEEKRTIEDDIKEVYAEARANGYDVKVLRAVVKHLGKDQNEVEEFDAIFDLYLQAYNQAGPASSRTHVARDAGTRTRGNTQHQPARPLAERDPQSAEHGSDSEGGAGGESPHIATGSEQGSAVEPQARNEPGSDLAASGGEGHQPLPETPAEPVIRGLAAANEIARQAAASVERAKVIAASGAMPEIPAFLRRSREMTVAGGEQ